MIRNSIAGLAVMAGLAAMAGPAGAMQIIKATPPAATVRPDKRMRVIGHDGLGLGWRKTACKGPGWTVRQVKRMATKRRNRARHRRSCRGSA